MTKFTNIDKGPRGLNTTQGKVWVDPGETVEVDLAKGEEAPADWFKTSGEAKKAAPAATNEFKAPYLAKDKGGGWWAIYDADGKEVKSLRKDDAEIFNALSDADKAAEVAKA